MRMLLTSGGIANDSIRATLIDLLGAPIAESKVVVVIDAMLGFGGDKSTMLEHLAGLHALGWSQFDILSLPAAPAAIIESRLREADVVLCYGGSNHWLAHAWTAGGFGPLLAELIETKVYVGWSAGSMIFSKLHLAAVKTFDDQGEVDHFGLDPAAPAIPLFDWWFVGHIGASWFPESTDEWAAAKARELGRPVWFLDDESALVVRDVANVPQVVSEGHWMRFGDGGALLDSH